jgi:hypothetical protein
LCLGVCVSEALEMTVAPTIQRIALAEAAAREDVFTRTVRRWIAPA